MTRYTCQKCQAPAAVVGGSVVPGCKCAAGILAHLQAVARGAGGVKS